MKIVEIQLGGLAGQGVGLFAVAVGYTKQHILESICVVLGSIAVSAYLVMSIDRYDRAVNMVKIRKKPLSDPFLAEGNIRAFSNIRLQQVGTTR